MTNEMINKAKECKSAEELLALAKENGYEMTAEEAAEKFAVLNNVGEMSDEELENAAGGSCHAKGGRMIVTVGYKCDHWTCEKCGGPLEYITIHSPGYGTEDYLTVVCNHVKLYTCNNCKHMSYEGGLWLCNHPENHK